MVDLKGMKGHLHIVSRHLKIHPSSQDGQWNFQGGRGLKGQNFRKKEGVHVK